MATTTNQPLPWVQPYMQDYLSRAQEVSNTPYTASPTQYTGPNQTLQQGWQAILNRATQGSPTMDAANQTLQKTLNGGFLNQNNPQLNNQIQAAQGDMTRAWNNVQKPAWEQAMQGSGSFGNTGVMEAYGDAANDFQRNLGRISSDMRFNAYNTERGYQNSALNMAPQFAQQDYNDANALLNVGNQQQGFNQAQNAQNYQWWQEAQQYPRNQLNVMGNALGIGGTGSQQTGPGVSPWSQALGGALTAGQLWSIFGGK